MSRLPAGWTQQAIGDVCLKVSKTDPSSSPDKCFTYIDISSIEGQRISEPKKLLGAEAPSRARQPVQTDDVVLSTVRTYLMRTALVPGELDGAVASTGFSVLRPRPDVVDPRWLFHWCVHPFFVGELNKKQTGSSYPAVRDRDVRAMPIPVPPLEEQRRIVSMTQNLLLRLHQAQQDLRRATVAASRLDDAATQFMVERDWPLVRIGQVTRVGSGATPSRSNHDYWDGGSVPWVTSAAVNGRRITEPSSYITERALKETSVKLWPPGTVLVAMYGEGKTRGKAAVLEIEASCNQACAAIAPCQTFDAEYLAMMLNSMYQSNRRLASGGVQPNLSLGLVRELEVPCPDRQTQQSVVDRGLAASTLGDHLRRSLRALEGQSDSLRSSILAAAFSGGLSTGEALSV